MGAARLETSGVYYHGRDYVGLGGRLLIDTIDVMLVAVLCVLAASVTSSLLPPSGVLAAGVLAEFAALWLGYFVFLKHSRFRTLGYRLAGARLVDLHGEAPGFALLLGRLGFMILGPLNPLLDILFIAGDKDRQGIRDKLSGTYVVRRNAEPAGAGPMVLRAYALLGWFVLVREVVHPAERR